MTDGSPSKLSSFGCSAVPSHCPLLLLSCEILSMILFNYVYMTIFRNNAMRKSMESLSLSSSTIASIIDNPLLLRSSSSSAAIGISTSQANFILSSGYNKGFKDIFYLNAALATLAFVASVVLIRHKELNRVDDAKLKMEAKEALRAKGATVTPGDAKELGGDIEMGPVLSESQNLGVGA